MIFLLPLFFSLAVATCPAHFEVPSQSWNLSPLDGRTAVFTNVTEHNTCVRIVIARFSRRITLLHRRYNVTLCSFAYDTTFLLGFFEDKAKDDVRYHVGSDTFLMKFTGGDRGVYPLTLQPKMRHALFRRRLHAEWEGNKCVCVLQGASA
jgi:hypothetical protein